MWRSFVIGLITGMRSQLPAALLAWRVRREELPSEVSGPAGLLRRSSSLPLTAAAAAGELVGDKLPATPSRTEPGPFVGRVVIGATTGAGLAGAFGESSVLGALLGGAGAVAGTLLGFRLRAQAVERTGVPDPVWAVAEDAVAIGLGLRATRP